MPLKKKKGIKKKKKSTSGGGEDEVAIDPDTVITAENEGEEGGSGKGGKKKKRRKKKKLSKSEKSTEKLEKAATKLKADKVFYNQFVRRMHSWLCKNAKLAVQLFKRFDSDGEGLVTYDEFKSGMLDMDCPCGKNELYLLCKLLDPDNTGDVDYTELPKGLKFVQEVDELNEQSEAAEHLLTLGERNIEHCKSCKLGISEPYKVENPRYIRLKFRLVTFDACKDHPGHFEVIVQTHISVYGLIRLIMEETGIQSTKISIFIDKTRRKAAMLPMEMSLDEIGYQGHTYSDPEKIKLYYDYKTEFNDCPILMCDHYFGQKENKLAVGIL